MDWTTGMTWMNPPPEAGFEAGRLRVVTGAATDFWRQTYYGFSRDNGHFLGREAEPELACEVWFDGHYLAQYDQAGLMLRADPAHWIKCGIEHVGGIAHLAVVVTHGRSDWSQTPLPGLTGPVGLRIVRRGDAVWVQAWLNGDWVMVRLAYFPPELAARVGLMCCSPSRAGFVVMFERFSLGAPQGLTPY